MSGHDDVGRRQDTGPIALELGLVRRVRIDRGRPVAEPPQVRHRVDRVGGVDDERGVLLGVARRQPQPRVRPQLEAIARRVEPEVVAITRPEVDDLCVREERDVDRVIGVVVAQEDVRDVVRVDVEGCKRVEDQVAAGDHAGVGNDSRVAIADKGDRAAHVAVVAGIAGVEEMDGGGRSVGSSHAGMVGNHPVAMWHPAAQMTEDRGTADLILTGGRVRTMDDAIPVAEAMAITGDRIVAVGTASDADAWRSPATRVIDLRGRTVTPGFQDAHCHPVYAGMDLLHCALHSYYRVEEYLEAIAAYAVAHADEPWIVGGGWSMGSFEGGYPDRELLDRVTGDRPAFFDNRDGHDAWVNTAALRMAGINRDTPDPADGRIRRDAHGDPTGVLHEGAMGLVTKILPDDTDADFDRALLIAQEHLHRLGITAWQDAIVRPRTEIVYRSVAARGDLTARVIGALWWDRDQGLEQIDDLVARRDRGPIGRYSPTSIKLMLDGIIENKSARLTEPYLDADGRPTEVAGLDFIEPARLHEAVTRLDALGFQCHFHAIGDGAVRLGLDACEAAAAANGRTDGRHHISHVQVIHPDDVSRFGRLSVVANAQPFWACSSEQMVRLNNSVLGPERTRWQYPFRSLLRTGARLAMGSDWAVSTPNPLQEMDVAIRRVDPHDFDTEPFLPNEALSLDEALAAFTRGSAYVNHLDETGVVAPGMLADLAVLDRDIHDAGERSLADARVVATLVGGAFVFEDAALEG